MSVRTRPTRWRIATVLLGALASGGAAWAAGGGFAGLGEDAEGFAEVRPGREFSFPADLGAHPDYRIEWWYVTANLEDSEGYSYGVQWTLFRQAMEPGPQRDGWNSQQVWMGHVSVTSRNVHHFAETVARGGIGQAGVETDPFVAWIDNWSFASDGTAGGGLRSVKLSAAGPEFSYALTLETSRPVVRHGDRGYSVKSEHGQASYYYSQPFFEAHGTLTLDGRDISVKGRAWMDREWSSQPLAPGQKGWDWFSLHLPGGEKLMLFQLRSDGDAPYYAGSWIGADGHTMQLGQDDIVLTPLRSQTVAGRSVPVEWSVEVKSQGLSITTMPLNPVSWMGTTFAYWEGPIRFTGTHAGEGYLEMTGY